MRKVFTSSLLFLFALSASVPASPLLRGDEGRQVIKLVRFRKALWKVHVTVKGKEGDFLFDTGGGVTLLTEAFSKGIDCKYWGRNTGYNMFGKRGDGPHCDGVQLTAGGIALTPVNIGKIDFGGQFPGDKDPDGLLALDAFDGKVITIDQQAATLTIETETSLKNRVRAMKEFPFRLARECSGRCLSAFLGVNTPDGMTWMNIDSGAGGVSLISKEYAASVALDPAKKEQQINHQIAPGIVIGGPVFVTDMIMDGNLGQPFLSNYIVTIDLSQGRMWIGEQSRTKMARVAK
ncbi:MAG TPA: aspartyl protease family protein [Pyrinomonadaceae bacterium]|nr:aspartyl protease family protein [Pyrinomonadaceae bacterium]